MYVLGISAFFHDSSASLLKDGVVLAAAEEERFSRKKHDSSFPYQAVRYCLQSQGITMADIDCLAYYEKPFLKFERILWQFIDTFPRGWLFFVSSLLSWLSTNLFLWAVIRKKLLYHGEVLFLPHHLSHAASTFFPSPFSNAAIVTIDGVGEYTTTAYGVGHGIDISLLNEICFPHSLGMLYSTITAYLGFSVNNSEYKIMGLSAYGDKNKDTNSYYDRLKRTITIKRDGSFALDMSYFSYCYTKQLPSRKLCDLLDGPIRKKNEPITKRHQDIAAALQLVTEDAVFAILNFVQRQTGETNLVLGGGIALNSVINGKIVTRTPFKNFWIQPNASDGGSSLGAALFAYHVRTKNKKRGLMPPPYLGPAYSQDNIERFAHEHDIIYRKFSSQGALLDYVADLLHQNYIIGWFQGGMEWGPRALGGRSILANPCNSAIQDILNKKVKHREEFRPFAPAICTEDVPTYFTCDNPLPEAAKYMLLVYPIKKEWRPLIPGVVHIDGSGRLQAVDREDNELFYDLIKTFGKKSGVPILINTSFNVRGEPIVCTPKDAYNCMMHTLIDYLVIGNIIIRRDDNLKRQPLTDSPF
ncbi:carbamoyltransferase [Candidatus Uhrbacteria bacterium]|nr:carbamoyltransferase [Candidatus Uhrbacteria bacterium]